jgi:hypothetical protein
MIVTGAPCRHAGLDPASIDGGMEQKMDPRIEPG